MRIRRALLSVSDKSGIVELGQALVQAGVELIATGKTAQMLKDAGLPIIPIEQVSGAPEAFAGRMKTLSFSVFSGILYRRGENAAASKDQEDLRKLGFGPIDCVVVNFYPFEITAAKPGISRDELIEEIDIGGPSLVRAAAKNAPDVLVLTSPAQYPSVIAELGSSREVSPELANRCAAQCWDRVLAYDAAISAELGAGKLSLKYGENPHQQAFLKIDPDSPIAWPASKNEQLTPAELSYNNILDISSAYGLAGDVLELGSADGGAGAGVVIVKHGNPCGCAWVERTPGETLAETQLRALERAWQGDPVSAFGGIVIFTQSLEMPAVGFLSDKFVEAVVAPGLTVHSPALKNLLPRRKNLKAVSIRRFGAVPAMLEVSVPGGRLHQGADTGMADPLWTVTERVWPESKTRLARFGIAVARALKSNAVAIVREIPGLQGSLQLIGGGQGQPNRIEALKWLAIPRARNVLAAEKSTAGLADCVLVSDAFFPFRDTVEAAHEAGLRHIVQPGGSVKDAESIAACNELGISMVFTGVRHFKH